MRSAQAHASSDPDETAPLSKSVAPDLLRRTRLRLGLGIGARTSSHRATNSAPIASSSARACVSGAFIFVFIVFVFIVHFSLPKLRETTLAFVSLTVNNRCDCLS